MHLMQGRTYKIIVSAGVWPVTSVNFRSCGGLKRRGKSLCAVTLPSLRNKRTPGLNLPKLWWVPSFVNLIYYFACAGFFQQFTQKLNAHINLRWVENDFKIKRRLKLKKKLRYKTILLPIIWTKSKPSLPKFYQCIPKLLNLNYKTFRYILVYAQILKHDEFFTINKLLYYLFSPYEKTFNVCVICLSCPLLI